MNAGHKITLTAGALLLSLAMPLRAQQTAQDVIRAVKFDQRLNEQIPLEAEFRDEEGAAVPLRAFFRGKPVVLALVYYDCPMLCTVTLNSMLKSMRAIRLNAGEEYDVLTVSFDAREGADLAQKKKEIYLKQYGRAGAAQGWRFLTGDAASIQRLTAAVGFQFVYDEKTRQFAHASGLVVLTPEGKVSRYLYGLEYSARDLRLALVEASQNKIGTLVDQVLLYCYHYDPAAGKYSATIMNIVRLAGSTTVLLIAALVLTLLRREKRVPHPRRA
jgi:protein SCO1/2